MVNLSCFHLEIMYYNPATSYQSEPRIIRLCSSQVASWLKPFLDRIGFEFGLRPSVEDIDMTYLLVDASSWRILKYQYHDLVSSNIYQCIRDKIDRQPCHSSVINFPTRIHWSPTRNTRPSYPKALSPNSSSPEPNPLNLTRTLNSSRFVAMSQQIT